MSEKYMGSQSGNATALVEQAERKVALVPPGFKNIDEWRGFQFVCQQAMKQGVGIPESVRSVEQAVAIALKGRELDLDPIYALNKISLIKGKVVMEAECMMNLIYRKYPNAHLANLTPLDDRNRYCIYEVARPGGPKSQYRFTVDDAVQAGLLNKNRDGSYTASPGRKTWDQYRATMLENRCISMFARKVFADCIGGAHTPEEIKNIGNTSEVSEIQDKYLMVGDSSVAEPQTDDSHDLADSQVVPKTDEERVADMVDAEIVDPVFETGPHTGKRFSEVEHDVLRAYLLQLKRVPKPSEAIARMRDQLEQYLKA